MFLFIFLHQASVDVKICVYIHISACVQTVYDVPLVPKSTASETFLHKPVAVRSVDWLFVIGL